MKVLVSLVIAFTIVLSFNTCTLAGQPATSLTATTTPDYLPDSDDFINIPMSPIPHIKPDVPSINNTEEAYDDIVPTPGGLAYRANVHQQGVPDKWPEVETASVRLEGGNYPVSLIYRNYIETRAGETRYNLFDIYTGNVAVDYQITLYAGPLPDGIELRIYSEGGGRPGLEQAVVAISMSPDIAAGSYGLKIGLELSGKYMDTLPCTIIVTE